MARNDSARTLLDELVGQVANEVEKHPDGIGRDRLRRNLPNGKRPIARIVIEEALARQVIFEGIVPAIDERGILRNRRVLSRHPIKDPPVMSAGELARCRARAGLKQNDIARELGVSVALVSYWESGTVSVPPWARNSIKTVFDRAPEILEDQQQWEDVSRELAAVRRMTTTRPRAARIRAALLKVLAQAS